MILVSLIAIFMYFSRLSGIGVSGSFQLSYVFQPSPVILAAQDTDSDYAESEEEEDTGKGNLKGSAAKDADIMAYQVCLTMVF